MPVRIYELAKQFPYDNKQLIDLIRECGIEGELSALSSLSENEVDQIKKHISALEAAGASGKQLSKAPPSTKPVRPEGRENTPSTPKNVPLAARRITPLKVAKGNSLTGLSRAVSRLDVEKANFSKQIQRPLLEKPAFNDDPFLIVLLQDLDLSLANLADNTDEQALQFYRRSYIRTFFSTADAILATIAEWLAENVGNIDMPNRERVFVRSSLNVTVENVTRYASVQYILATYGFYRGRGEDFFSDSGWDAFKKSRRIHNAMTHPRKERGVEVSEAEITTVRDAHRWLIDVFEVIES